MREAAESLGYRPHVATSNLQRSDGRTGTIGLLLADVGNPFSASIHRAIEDVARERGVLTSPAACKHRTAPDGPCPPSSPDRTAEAER